MYAIIRAGGKQAKVQSGDVIDIERVKTGEEELTFAPLLVVDDKGKAVSDRQTLAEAKVTAKVLGESSGPKIDIFKYKSKTGYRRRQGHRQKYTRIEITDINLAGGPKKKATPEAKKTATTTPAKKTATAAKKPAATTAKKPAAKKTATAAKKPAATTATTTTAKKPAAKKTTTTTAKKPATKKTTTTKKAEPAASKKKATAKKKAKPTVSKEE